MSKPFTILLVDDDSDDVELTKRVLARLALPLEIHSASNGEEALSLLRGSGRPAAPPRPDLILLDLNMPVMDGRELLSLLKADKELAPIPVVILTTSNAAEEVVNSYGMGASGYVNKPLQLSQFEELKQVVLDFYSARRASA